MLEALLFGLLFAIADRLAGGDYCKRAADWLSRQFIPGSPPWLVVPVMAVARMRSVAWATLLLAAALAFLAQLFHLGLDIVLYAVGFAAWRWDGWTATGSGIAPVGIKAVELYGERQAFIYVFFPIFLLQDLVFGRNIQLLGAAFFLAVFVIVAASLGILLAWASARGRDINTWIELSRGFVMGLVVAASLAC